MYTASALTISKQDRRTSNKTYAIAKGISSRFYKLQTIETHKNIDARINAVRVVRGFVLSGSVAELKITNPNAPYPTPEITNVSCKLYVEKSDIIDKVVVRVKRFRNNTNIVSPNVDVESINGEVFNILTFTKPIEQIKSY